MIVQCKEEQVHKVIIEVRINESAGRDKNANVPWSAAEIAKEAQACVAAGASIIHFHPRLPDGKLTRDYAVYRDTMRALRNTCDALIHPTLLPFPLDADVDDRLDPIVRLAADRLQPDLVPIIIASANFDFPDKSGRPTTGDQVILNTTRMTRLSVERLGEMGVVPYADVWHVPALRQVTASARAGLWPSPLCMMLALIADPFTFGHPATPEGLRAYLDLLPRDIALHWSVYGAGTNLLAFIPQIVEARGHISIGLGDYPYLELGQPTNADVVTEAVRVIRSRGAQVATSAEVRQALGVPRLEQRLADSSRTASRLP